MAITGTLMSALANFSANSCTLHYSVNLKDDQLGFLGNRNYTVNDSGIITNVMAYVQQMLPTIEAQVGIPISLPELVPSPTPNTSVVLPVDTSVITAN